MRKATLEAVWASWTLYSPLPHRRRRDRCPCGECCVRRELSSPGEVGFPAKAALAVGLVVGGLRGGEGARLRYRCCGTRCWRPEVKDGAYPAGGDLDGGEGTAIRERRGEGGGEGDGGEGDCPAIC